MTFTWTTEIGAEPLVLHFCADHAEDKARHATVVWLENGWTVCPWCFRILPTAQVEQTHFNTLGAACPPDRRAPVLT